jgi:hypothetical protein
MPDPIDQALEKLLAYPETGSGGDLFVVDVMKKVQAERRRRRLILALFGGIGALFGLAGAVMLSGSISHVFTELLPNRLLFQLPLFAAGAVAFYVWAMNDDLPLGT